MIRRPGPGKLVASVALLAFGCATSAVHWQNLVVWNQTDAPEQIRIAVDDQVVYSGQLGTLDFFPKIVIQRQLGFSDGEHVLDVEVPGRGFHEKVPFRVGPTPVNLHVMLNRDEVQVGATYGNEAYL